MELLIPLSATVVTFFAAFLVGLVNDNVYNEGLEALGFVLIFLFLASFSWLLFLVIPVPA